MTLGLADDRTLIGMFTQALWQIDGYRAQWEMLISRLAQNSHPPAVIVRRHPRDGATGVRTIKNMLAAADIADIDASSLTVEEALCACDVVVSAFSSVATDLCYLQRQANAPLGIPLLLLIEPGVRRHFEGQCGFAVHPLVKRGLAMEVDRADRLDECLAHAGDPTARAQIWRGCRGLPAAANAAKHVIARLQADWIARTS
jgi:hypothetical protein